MSSGPAHTPPDAAPDLTVEQISARLDRLPMSGVSRRILLVMGAAFFFDLADQSILGIVAPTLRAQLGFELGDIAILVSCTYTGLFLGAVLGGRAADRLGRLPVIVAALLTASLGSGLHALTESLQIFMALRLLSGIGMGALFVTALTYVVEISPLHRRGSRTALTYFAGMCGSAVIATLSRFIIPSGPDGWRVFFALGVFGVVVIPLLRGIPESPLWLHSRGRLQDAESALARLEIGTANGQSLPAVETTESNASVQVQDESSSGEWRNLFRGSLLRTTILLCLIWIVYASITQTFSSWLPTILQLRGFSGESLLTINAIAIYGSPLGCLLAFLVADRLSRRVLMVGTAVGAALCSAIYGAVPVAGIIAGAAFGHFVMIAWFAPLLAALMAESFPSNLRSTGSGVAFGAGRMSNIVVPFTLSAALTSLGPSFVGWYMALGWLAVAAAAAVLMSKRKSTAEVSIREPKRIGTE
ncbi:MULTISPECIES: MFS transporter [Rhodococcus]|uniref:MFS transporter n=1 Tax=Rhodococcus oxybenzonivorans TaxID=1990687 RepID=A0AAE4V0B8_9NOCA|nr:MULTISPECIES: MFS transporter [Rhodococcus]MDV7240546.1 MFS transporter [Rhodococcus oxybenzonivorans]MDV7265759.1 MFS transporter [Rhodococcus oxybenzonivorans]MDV7272819.1 MFS transporter [Rhodococcus oxybenzonivorans]MDV7333442.1 MFS transporter [Rhodococcus oxybenzonivorans]MDV7342609.1 MFS transporter [Rhodococcus oxybenzonivorans]